jgi:hypothetical protein
MKLPSLFLLGGCLLVTTSDAFTTTTSSTRRQSNDNFELRAVNVKRRDVFASTAAGILATGGALVGMPAAALAAADYVPQLKDMQQIYCKSAALVILEPLGPASRVYCIKIVTNLICPHCVLVLSVCFSFGCVLG